MPKTLRTMRATLFSAGFAELGPEGARRQRELVEKKRWMTREEFVEDWAVAQIMPGPNVVNLSLMIGGRYFGLRGAMAALAGMLTVPLLVVLALALVYAQFAGNAQVAGALRGMGAVAAGLITATGLKLLPALRRNALGPALCGALGVAAFAAIALLKLPLFWVLLALGTFLVVIGLMAATWAPGQVKRTPLDTATAIAVEADTGNIGGSASHEFMVLADTGEETIVYSDQGTFAANVERAEVLPPEKADTEDMRELKTVSTPNCRTIEEVTAFLKIPAHRLVKLAPASAVRAPVLGNNSARTPSTVEIAVRKIGRNLDSVAEITASVRAKVRRRPAETPYPRKTSATRASRVPKKPASSRKRPMPRRPTVTTTPRSRVSLTARGVAATLTVCSTGLPPWLTTSLKLASEVSEDGWMSNAVPRYLAAMAAMTLLALLVMPRRR